MKVLLTSEYTRDEIESLEALGYEIIIKPERDLAMTEKIRDIDIMVCSNPFRRIDIDEFPNLKWVQLLTAGINQVPIEKFLKNDIVLTNNRGGYSIPIAEWIVLKILEMIKNTRGFYRSQDERLWRVDTSPLELYGKTIGFIGTGSIAQEAAKRLEPFGVDIIGINFSGRPTEHFHSCVSVDKIHHVLPQCQFIVIAAPATEDTYRLLDREAFANMRDGTYIVNIARGSIIDEEALIESLNSGKIKKAALDVFEKEPLPEKSPLWEMDNVLISPHNSWASEMDRSRVYDITYKNLKNYIEGKPLINIIELAKGY